MASTLYQQIKHIYSDLTDADFDFSQGGTIELEKPSDKDEYIARWNHPSKSKPTADQLKTAKDALG